MKIPLSFKRMSLAPGKAFSVPTEASSRVRVVDGLVWATTSGSPEDLWLAAGDEHTVRKPGLTVIESVARSTVEVMPHPPRRRGGPGSGRYEIATRRALCNIAAVALTVVTFGLLVVLPAKVSTSSAAPLAAAAASASSAVRPAIVDSGGMVTAREATIAQAAGEPSTTTRVR